MYCKQLSLVNTKAHAQEACVLKCHNWHCENCEPGRREALRQLALAGRPRKFLTLTVNPAHGVDADDRARSLIWAWRILLKRIKRRTGQDKIPYLWVVEATKNDEPHLHILLRAPFIEQAFISDVMNELIHAPIVDIRMVSNEKAAARYVSKYCSKDARKFAGCKRYGYSADWIDDEEYLKERAEFTTGNWRLHKTRLQDVARLYVQHGYELEWHDDDHLSAHRTERVKEGRLGLPWLYERPMSTHERIQLRDWEKIYEHCKEIDIVRTAISFSGYAERKALAKRANASADRLRFVPPKSWARHVPLRRVYAKRNGKITK